MPTNRYNGRPADVEIVPKGTDLYRIMAADATYAANSFNMKPRPLGHPEQGRFEPTDAGLCGGVSQYSQTRQTGTKILLKTKPAFGMRYRCRNHDNLTSLMLITRKEPALSLTLIDEVDIFFDKQGRDLILDVLHTEFQLQYTGALPN